MADKLLIKPLEKNIRIAFICSACMGDALIAMVTVNNLVHNGYMVDVFGNFVYALREWFPWVQIFPSIKIDEQKKLAAYLMVLHMYDGDMAQQVQEWHPDSITLSNSPLYKAQKSMVDIQVTICEQEFGLHDVVRTNNIKPLAQLQPRQNKQRIVMHPTLSLIHI